jgi:hypothetical protein
MGPDTDRVDARDVDRILIESERTAPALAPGFWKAVAATKRDPELIVRYADRIARIDRASFERRVPLRVPVAVGLVIDAGGVAVGVGLMAFATSVASPWRELAFLAGMLSVLGVSHTLAHWIVGAAVGIRFTHAFVIPPKRPQPGFKIDYASYLRTPARARAWMHAAGAIVTKLVPFAALPSALGAGLAAWAIWLLVAIGVIQIATDALWSVRASDWKKFRREMRFVG